MSYDPNYVKWVQRSLNRLMRKKIDINGIREGNFEYTGAIAEFKAIYGIDEPGLTGDQIGAKCQDAIVRFNNNGGDYGDYCAWLCKVVPNAPAQAQGVSGVLESAVRKFQQKEKLKVDGWVGYKTELRLIEISKTEPPGSKPGDTPKGGNHPSPDIEYIRNGITDILDRFFAKHPERINALKNTVGAVASNTLGLLEKKKEIQVWKAKGGGWLAGAIIQPLIWYRDGNTGDAGDKLLYVAGLFPLLGLAAGAVGIWKGVVDDMVLKKAEEIKAEEPWQLAKTIYPTATYNWEAHPENAARKIAAMGGVAWQHQNGLWVYSKLEKNNKVILTCDTKPKNAIKILGPELPLQLSGYGGFVWRTYKG